MTFLIHSSNVFEALLQLIGWTFFKSFSLANHFIICRHVGHLPGRHQSLLWGTPEESLGTLLPQPIGPSHPRQLLATTTSSPPTTAAAATTTTPSSTATTTTLSALLQSSATASLRHRRLSPRTPASRSSPEVRRTQSPW